MRILSKRAARFAGMLAAVAFMAVAHPALARAQASADGGPQADPAGDSTPSPGTAIQGVVGIQTGTGFWLLDGPGITGGTVTAQSVSSSVLRYVAPITGGQFTLPLLLPGWYTVTATLTYEDHILVDSRYLSAGCAAPSTGVLQKQVVSKPVRVLVTRGAAAWTSIPIGEPLVMLHGILDCYQKWYGGESPDSSASAHWDDYARSQGVLSFTPNYVWWGSDTSWDTRADQIFEQVSLDLERLSSSAPVQEGGSAVVPYAYVAHGMGGLIVRVLASGAHGSDPLIAAANKVFLLGTPNSGTDLVLGGGPGNILGSQTIMRSFNTAYPDFGSLESEVYPIAGNKDWWGQGTSDGSVPLASVFLVSQIACSSDAFGYPACKAFPALALPSGAGHLFPYTHQQLGSPDSTAGILAGVVLPSIQPAALNARTAPERYGVPEAPVSTTMWGTTARTTGWVSSRLAESTARRAESAYSFQVSQTDGVGFSATVTSGSGAFQVTDPSGATYSLTAQAGSGGTAPGSNDYLFTQLAPLPGQWTLTALPDPGGMAFSASCYEDSTFGITGYPTEHSYTPGELVALRLDIQGDLSGLSGTSAQAVVTDPFGNRQTVPLYDDGQHDDGAPDDGAFGGFLTAPTGPGVYRLEFDATGTSEDAPFRRVAFDSLAVLTPAHVFTGTFSDSPYDADGDGRDDGIVFSAGIQAPRSGPYTLSADLLDAGGNFIGHATSTQNVASPSASLTLAFDLGAAYCVQFGAPFQVVNLSLVDPSSLNLLDVWPTPVRTAAYPAGTFLCNQGTPGPEVRGLDPAQGLKGQVLTVLVGGNSFAPGATVTVDPDISVLKTLSVSDRLLAAVVSISPTAAPGGHPLTVTNANGAVGTLPNALSVLTDQPPLVTFQVPHEGDSLQGTTPVSVAVTGNAPISKVEFYLDGALMATDTQFPFKWSLDATALSKGVHALSATAYDSAGQSSSTAIVVYKNPPEVTAVRSLSNPFRIRIQGRHFRPGLKAYIGSDAQPWPNLTVSNSRRVVLGGDGRLKGRFPPGQPVTIRLLNADGTEVATSFTAPTASR